MHLFTFSCSCDEVCYFRSSCLVCVSRMIVVAEKSIVYEKFPIPLINRLEKHFLAMNTMLSKKQKEVADRLQKWAEGFTKLDRGIADRR